MQSLGELDRDIFEEYLIHLKTDRTRTEVTAWEITRLQALLEAVGKTYKYPILENLIVTEIFHRLQGQNSEPILMKN